MIKPVYYNTAIEGKMMRAIKILFCLGILLLIFPTYTTAFSQSYCEYIMGSDDLSKFHIAACRGDVNAVNKFIEQGINLNQPFIINAPFWNRNNHYEFNSLHTALSQDKESSANKDNYRKIIELLINNGIDAEYPFRWWYANDIKQPPTHVDEYRPINMASNYEIAKLLKKGGAKLSPLIFSQNKGEFNYFRGDIIVSGKINVDPYSEYFPNMLCMSVDKDTFYLIPRVADFRSAWFCLEDDGTLFAKMKINGQKIKDKCFSGVAKIQITNYQQYIGESEDADYAKLVKVIEAKDYSYNSCQSNE
jgi:hypothetical protein